MKLPDGWVAIVHADAKATKIDMETRELVMCRNCGKGLKWDAAD